MTIPQRLTQIRAYARLTARFIRLSRQSHDPQYLRATAWNRIERIDQVRRKVGLSAYEVLTAVRCVKALERMMKPQ